MAIKHPMLNRRFGGNRTVHGVVIGSAWLLSGVYSLPWLIAYDVVTMDRGTAYCYNTLPLLIRVYAMVNFFVLYVAPLIFMTFLYVRISIILWRSSTVQSLPLISLHLLPHGDHLYEQRQQQHRESGALYMQRSTSTSRSRLFLHSSCPTSPYLSAKSLLHTNSSQSRLHGLNNDVVTPTAAGRHLSASELALPVAATMSRRPTTSISGRRLTQLKTDNNFLMARRKVVRLLAAIVISFALCMLPHHVRVQWQEWARSSSYSNEEMYIPPVTTLVFYVNSCLNPLLYALISDKFRQAFATLRCCRQAGTAPPPASTAARRPVVAV